MPHVAALSARACSYALAAAACLLASGCLGHRVVYPVMPTSAELAEFEAAGPPDLQRETLDVRPMLVAGPYRIVVGDLLAFELPPEVNAVDSAAEAAPTSVASLTVRQRVRADGNVLLPMVGTLAAAGKTTGELEEDVAQRLREGPENPNGLLEEPGIVVTVSEYKTVSVSVSGAVNQPGLHELRSDQRSVMAALAAAGGIKSERGAREIRVLSQDADGNTVTHTLAVMLAEIPLSDLELQGGETIVVEPPAERQFSVIGLVKKNGNFEYPAPRRYNLLQALATAGGVDEIAAPRYATIYRRKADGSVLAATFRIDGLNLTDGSNITIKDGDVIAVEHTAGSYMRQFFSQVLGFRANLSATSSSTL
jgi:polysaccharide export outer membrane protein